MRCNATTDIYQCINSQVAMCDGVPDCPDGEDERHCPTKPACSQFSCPNAGQPHYLTLNTCNVYQSFSDNPLINKGSLYRDICFVGGNESSLQYKKST